MKQPLNTADIKKRNQRLVLDAVFASGCTSRTELSRQLSLSKPAISDNLAALLRAGIVEEAGESSASPAGGRKSILLHFNADYRYIITANLNFSHPVFAVGNLRGEILKSLDISIPNGTPSDICMRMVSSQIAQLLEPLDTGKVFCIAVAAPGTFDADSHLVSFNRNCGGPAWWQVNLKAELESDFHLPVIIYNDVKAAALGEWVYGAGREKQSLLYLSAGLGIGSGIILDGKMLVGERYNAGEIYDHVDSLNMLAGINLEDTICMEHLKTQCLRIQNSPFAGQQDCSLKDIVQSYGSGDPVVGQIVDQICRQLAILTFNYMNFLSISSVVFGGEYAPFGECYARHLQALFSGTHRPHPCVRTAELGSYSGIHGMLYLARQACFDQTCS